MPKYSPNAVKSISEILDGEVTATDLYRQVNEVVAAEFLDSCPRQMQKLRREGGGPAFIAISPKCIRYRVIDLIRFQEERLRENNIKPIDPVVANDDREPDDVVVDGRQRDSADSGDTVGSNTDDPDPDPLPSAA